MLLTMQQLMQQAGSKVNKMPAAEALPLCQQQNAMLIDVREPTEFAQSPVIGAINIPRGVLEMSILQQVSDAGQPLYLHCASGNRATLAAEQLQRIGYSNVTVISCNIDAIRAVVNEK